MFDLPPQIYAVSLRVNSCRVVFCLNISDNLLMACNFLSPMDSNGDVDARF